MASEAATFERDPKQQAVLERLLELGLILEIKNPRAASADTAERRPIPLGNRPGSKLLLEERR